jgi:mannosyltransferase
VVSSPALTGGHATRRGLRGGVGLLLVSLVAVGVLLRLFSTSALWLDEALSVNIASLPVPDLLAALRHDGSPPLYYLILHGWIEVFGTGTTAVRALSSCLSLAALPVAYRAGRLLGGRGTAQVTVVLVATNPFLIRYATETRMYTLLVLLVALGVVAVRRAQLRPDLPRLLQVAVVSGLLMLTHYWAFFLIGTFGLVVTFYAVRGPHRATAVRLMVAVASGALLFLPWVGGFLFQLRHTGTPWAEPPGVREVLTTLPEWAGGTDPTATALALLLLAAAAIAVLPARVAGGPTDLVRRRGRTATSWALLACSCGALVLAVLASRVLGAGYALRYTAPFVLPMLLVVAVGLRRLRRGVLAAALLVAALIGTGQAVHGAITDRRTQAPLTAELLNNRMRAGDAVVYCPDQLGPAVSRLLPATVPQFVYPTLAAPQLVDWVDYAQRNAAASPARIASVVSRQVPGTIWLVTDSGYLTFGKDCERFAATLTTLRGASAEVQHSDGYFFENTDVLAFPAPGPE